MTLVFWCNGAFSIKTSSYGNSVFFTNFKGIAHVQCTVNKGVHEKGHNAISNTTCIYVHVY